MKKIRLILAALVVVILGSASVFAAENVTYSIDAIGVKVDIPDDILVITRKSPKDDNARKAFGYESDESWNNAVADMKDKLIYLRGKDANSTYEISITGLKSNIIGYQLKTFEQQVEIAKVSGKYTEVADEELPMESFRYEVNGRDVIATKYASSTSQYLSYFIFNTELKMAYTYTIQVFGELTGEKEQLLQKIAESGSYYTPIKEVETTTSVEETTTAAEEGGGILSVLLNVVKWIAIIIVILVVLFFGGKRLLTMRIGPKNSNFGYKDVVYEGRLNRIMAGREDHHKKEEHHRPSLIDEEQDKEDKYYRPVNDDYLSLKIDAVGGAKDKALEEMAKEESFIAVEEPVVTIEEPVVEIEEPVVEESFIAVEKPVVEIEEPEVEIEEPFMAFEEPEVEIEEPVVEIEEPVVEIEEPVVEIDEPVVEIEEPVVEIDEPVVEIEEPVVEIEEPVVEESFIAIEEPVVEESFIAIEEPVVEIEEPEVEVEEPFMAFEEPVVEIEEPVVTIEEPVVEIEEPVVEESFIVVEEPVVEIEEPVVEIEEPIVEIEEPVVEIEEPVVEIEDPVVEIEEPVVEIEEPVVEVEEPVVEIEEPVVEIEEPVVEESFIAVEEPVAEIEEPVVETEVPLMTLEEPIIEHIEEPKVEEIQEPVISQPAMPTRRTIVVPDGPEDEVVVPQEEPEWLTKSTSLEDDEEESVQITEPDVFRASDFRNRIMDEDIDEDEDIPVIEEVRESFLTDAPSKKDVAEGTLEYEIYDEDDYVEEKEPDPTDAFLTGSFSKPTIDDFIVDDRKPSTAPKEFSASDIRSQEKFKKDSEKEKEKEKSKIPNHNESFLVD